MRPVAAPASSFRSRNNALRGAAPCGSPACRGDAIHLAKGRQTDYPVFAPMMGARR
jgi:hypothetical protein